MASDFLSPVWASLTNEPGRRMTQEEAKSLMIKRYGDNYSKVNKYKEEYVSGRGTQLRINPEVASGLYEEVLERGTIEFLKKAGLGARVANPVGLGLTIAASSVSTIGEQAFEKEERLAKRLGVTRNDILKLPQAEKEKLFKMVEDQNKKQELAAAEKKAAGIATGEQFRSLSNAPTIRDSSAFPAGMGKDNGNIATDPMLDQMLMSGQI